MALPVPSNPFHYSLSFDCYCVIWAVDNTFNIFSENNQEDATFLNLFVPIRCSACFGQFFRPSSGALNCTYSVRHLSDRYCYLLLAV